MAANGTYENPADKRCWETCQGCYRCAAKGTRLACRGCSGRFDLHGVTDPIEDDRCRCTEGILQYVKKDATFVQIKYRINPFKGKVLQIEKTEDERDWEAYLNELRERFEDEHYDPIQAQDYGV